MREATDSEKGFTDAPNVWYDGKFGRVKCRSLANPLYQTTPTLLQPFSHVIDNISARDRDLILPLLISTRLGL